MQNWGYKAATTKLDKAGTLLLLERGFLCRSAHNDDGTAAANVGSVQVGDLIHTYFSRDGKHDEMGAFEVVAKTGAARIEAHLGDVVPGTALYEVTNPMFIQEIDKLGAYAPDQSLAVFTGWALRRVGRARTYAASNFPGQLTLVRLP